MRTRLHVCTLITAALALTSCQAGTTIVETTEVAPAVYEIPEGTHIGEPMEPRKPVNFATVDASPSDYFDQTVLVKATVTGVCASKGCWMQVEDEGKTAMVRWEAGCGGKYAFPQDLIGKDVLVQGSFYPKVLSEEDAAHIEEESKEDVTIERDGYEFNASAVLLVANEG